MSAKKVCLNYNDFEELLKQMVADLSSKNYIAVHGLPRGGLPIAVHLSHFLQLPLVTNITHFVREFPNNELLLVVDDIVDTGRTYQRFLEIAKIKKINFELAVLYYKPHSQHKPQYYIKETLDWIVFPWELNDEIPNRMMYHCLGGNIDADNITNFEDVNFEDAYEYLIK